MTPSGKARRACTLLKVGRGQPARPMVANRPLFAYWAILMPHFRGVLLPPQNRSDESIQWAWTETAGGEAVAAAELATIRKRLAGAQQSLADSLEDAAGLADKAATIRATKNRMDEVVGALVALPDAALAAYVARTDRGMLLHSWGLTNPLPVQYLDADFELGGRVLVAGKPASGHEVLLESADGKSVARTGSDAEGRFEFSKVATGSYRVRAVSRPPEIFFPEKGETVEILGASVTTVEIRNEDQSRKPVPLVRGKPAGRRIRLVVATGAVLLAIAAYYFWPGRNALADPSAEGDPSGWGVNSAPRSVGQQRSESPDEPKEHTTQAAIRTGAAVQPASKTPRTQKSPLETAPEEGNSRARDIRVAQSTSGLPAELAGQPAGNGGMPGGAAGAGTGAGGGGGQGGGHGTGSSAGSGGSPAGAGAGSASTSDGTAASPSAASPQTVSESAAAKPPPPTGRSQGSSASKASSPTASASEAKTGSSHPAGTDTPSASEVRDAKPADANTSDKKAAHAEANPDAATAEALSDASALSDSDAPVSEEDAAESAQKQPEETSNESTGAPAPLQEGNAPVAISPGSTASDSTLVVRMVFRSSPWRRLLLRDTIVPTLPTRIGQDDAMSDLGARMLAEKQSSVPRGLQDGRMVVGVRLEFSTPALGGAPRWSVASGAAPLMASADANAAEIGWHDGASIGRWALVAADGRMIASVVVDTEGAIRLASADRVSGWPWVGIEGAPAEAGRFDWQIVGSGSVPSSWVKNDHWLSDRGRRLDLKSQSEQDETVVLTLAVVDASTGWALTSKVEHQQKVRR